MKYAGEFYSELPRSGSDIVKGARIALDHMKSIEAVLEESFRNKKNGRQGTSSDQEQDLLRAKLVMTSAGLDAVFKHLCYTAIPYLASAGNTDVQKTLEEFMKSLLLEIPNAKIGSTKLKSLTKAILSKDPMEPLVEQYVQQEFDGSLQSREALCKAARLLGIGVEHIVDSKSKAQLLDEIFKARNNIIHELDLDPSGTKRKRNQRRVIDITKYCNTLYAIAKTSVDLVESKVDKANADKLS